MGRLLLILFWLVVAFLALWAFGRRARRDRRPSAPTGARRDETMVRCAHCGVFLPDREAVRAQGRPYCSREHSKMGGDGG